MDNSIPNSLSLSCSTKEELPQIAQKIIVFANQIRVWLFVGDLGAGKTTLIKELCLLLGVKDDVSSPTFAIINEYMANRSPIYHFDFYRLKNEEEAINIGVNEYFNSGSYCFIEWPQKVENIMPEELLLVEIEGAIDEHRVFKLTKYE